MEGVRVEGVRVEGVRVEGVRVEGAGVEGAGVEGVRVEGVRVEGVRVEGVRVEGVRVEGAGVEGMGGANKGGSDGWKKDQEEGATPEGATLEGATPEGATPEGTTPEGATGHTTGCAYREGQYVFLLLCFADDASRLGAGGGIVHHCNIVNPTAAKDQGSHVDGIQVWGVPYFASTVTLSFSALPLTENPSLKRGKTRMNARKKRKLEGREREEGRIGGIAALLVRAKGGMRGE